MCGEGEPNRHLFLKGKTAKFDVYKVFGITASLKNLYEG